MTIFLKRESKAKISEDQQSDALSPIFLYLGVKPHLASSLLCVIF